MKLIVAGSRGITSAIIVGRAIDRVRSIIDVTEIVSGAAKGVDSLGAAYGESFGILVTEFPADWKLGKSAGYIRNTQMGNYADCLLAVWDGVSPGTGHMVEFMKSKGKRVWVWTHLNRSHR